MTSMCSDNLEYISLNAERNGIALKCPFQVNGHTYKRGYYLTDGIYPTWSTFMKTYPYPVDPNEKKFKRLQEWARKDVERAFSVLKGKWDILKRLMCVMTVDKIMSERYTCIILHNTVLEELMDRDTHFRLRNDLVVHLAAQDLPYLEEEGED
ncbi:uncharacterized protein LOC118492082 [Helianthus annuus]|uniref:uncharacterized protein LOC118492082 n=1 Tax=Helianthus annuus TaxID=4232 RepID=UPI001652E076|nr:uncharacterized protein LOC118492082 [Helianthus annuus]